MSGSQYIRLSEHGLGRARLQMLHGEMGRAELMVALGLKDEKHFRTHYLQAALAAGLLAYTLPDKPNSRLQKYKLTAQGKQWINRAG